jgi:hypothetical protein
MKKVIRLSENDLINIVKRIVNEQNDPLSPATSIDKYQERIKDAGKTFKFQQVSKELMPKYLQWYEGSSYPEIQEYISKTYGIPRLFDPKSLETAGKGNVEAFKQFLNAVKSSLTAAANEGYNGYVFGKNYDFAKLDGVKVMGDKLDPNWMSTLENTLPIIGTLPEFKKFVSKIISLRRRAIGLKD